MAPRSTAVHASSSSLLVARIFYGDKVHYLCTRAGVVEVRQIMEQMSDVVKAMLRRVKVDLSGDEVGVALQTFSVRRWGDAQRRPELRTHAATLCNLLKLPSRTVVPVVASLGVTLHSIVCAAKAQGLNVSNKQAWSWALWPVWRAQHVPKLQWLEDCEVLISFYLSLKINTTTLERNLGELLQQLNMHSGPLAETGASVASIMEVSAEGPQKEEEFFHPPTGPGGALEPSGFAVKCGQLWLEHFGRRFRQTYRTNNPQAPRSQGSQDTKHRPGTLASIAAGQGSATAAIVSAATHHGSRKWAPASFVRSMILPMASQPDTVHLRGTRWGPIGSREAQASEDDLQNFEKRTDLKRKRFLRALADVDSSYIEKELNKFVLYSLPGVVTRKGMRLRPSAGLPASLCTNPQSPSLVVCAAKTHHWSIPHW